MNRRTWIVVAAILAVMALAYVGSPFWAARQFKQAALSGDVDRLEAAVDFPSVRESLKSQLTIAMTQRMQSDPEMRSNPFAGLGLMILPAMVGKMVDAYVTPDGMSAMMRSGKVRSAKVAEPVKADVDYDYSYRTLDRFAVTAKASDAKADEVPNFVFERRGILSWKLIRIEIPAAAFADRAR
jgi:hypothetical protein